MCASLICSLTKVFVHPCGLLSHTSPLCMWSWQKAALFCSHTHALCTPDFESCQMLFQHAGLFPQRSVHTGGSRHKVRLHRQVWVEHWDLPLMSHCAWAALPFPHTCISSTQSHSICMEIWAPQLESHKALSSTNSYYLFGLLPHKSLP